MEGEVKEYDQYLTGDVWGFIIEDDDGNELDSHWGFFGFDDCKAAATRAADYTSKTSGRRRLASLSARAALGRMNGMRFIYNDGGRAAAGYGGVAGDCVARAIAIAAQLPYERVYHDLNQLTTAPRTRWLAKAGKISSARSGVYTHLYGPYLLALGWDWTGIMGTKRGRVHLRQGELPMGRLIVSLCRHLCAVIDGVLHDTFDCSRDGTACVYGYWRAGRGNSGPTKEGSRPPPQHSCAACKPLPALVLRPQDTF